MIGASDTRAPLGEGLKRIGDPTLDAFAEFSPEQMRRLAELDPTLYEKVRMRIDLADREREREEYEDSLIAFMQRAWREIDAAELSVNWHHGVIAEYLENITAGTLRNLVINVPPRCTKSLLVNVIYPAWVWAQPPERRGPICGPQVSFLCVSYGATLAEEIAVKMRRLVLGEWYQRMWGDRVKILEDQQSRANFGNASGGERISSSVEGGLLGRGGDCLAAGTMVNTLAGPKLIENLDAAAPEYILSYDFGTKTPTYRRLVAVARRRAKRLWRVHTRHGCVVEATGDHKVFTRRGWVQVLALVAGDVLLRCLPEAIDSLGRRDGQVGQKSEGRPVLQPFVRDNSEEYKRGEIALVLPGMRESAAIEGQTPELSMQSGMPISQRKAPSESPAECAVSPLRNMPNAFQTDEQHHTGSLLLEGVQKCGPFGTDEKPSQSGLPTWAASKRTTTARMVFAEATGVGSGRLSLRGLQQDDAGRCAPYKLDAKRQQVRECRLPVQSVPQETPCWGKIEAEEDTVSLVECIYPEADADVFDIQIDGTSCFFANGILVHNCQILDDVISPGEANSQLERERVMRAISEGLATRVRNPQTSARIMVMQRLHMDDPTNYALENWRPRPMHLMFPMRYEPDRACPQDPRQYDGELLWPAVWDEESVAKTELDMGDYASASQFQQSPIPRGGGIISASDWNIWPEFTPKVEDMKILPDGTMFIPLPDSMSRIIVVLDTAMKETETADWNACIAFGVWHRPRRLVKIVGRIDDDNIIDDGEQPRVIMMGGWRRRCKLNDEGMDRDGLPKGLVQRVIAFARRFNADELIIEDASRGLDVKNEIMRQVADMPFQISLFNPKKHGDKTARLHAISSLFSQGLVYAPANCVPVRDRAGNETVEIREFAWVREIFSEVEQVPRGAHDDYADVVSMSLLHLRDNGYLALTREYVAEQTRMRLMSRRSHAVREKYGV